MKVLDADYGCAGHAPLLFVLSFLEYKILSFFHCRVSRTIFYLDFVVGLTRILQTGLGRSEPQTVLWLVYE